MSFAMTGWAMAAAIGYGAYSVSEGNTAKKTQASANQQAERKALDREKNLGNVSKADAQKSASRSAFRDGLYFTSPTGLGTGGSRGRSRLMGA
ncbi:MAG: hypothetical protein P9L90_05245 [Candidatus Aadella gelida]|nr:hypothetical protein [Candidatus Aadella gelida]